ncbi:polysaccharide biosynthesis tyrosine autokinase [Paeniglutamicibacter sp. Y32M11]|uniref:polysaccharide biosynthesis tyrosine autokinase n=1 Tax=Paeniglutamicibacter sp. Y32M11 TaxID=2853258 RepID=UPI001C53333D|nr:polysaccharide biosynthesis tyrosine autokinase [Paeniglutamicibacter sp. Y32M11]QXQ09651.1 polysaccharide biosynthesis tyrosine autokinase [Paeniglutamicibacter sp. Y32M11]
MEPTEINSESGADLRYYVRVLFSFWRGIVAIFLICLLLTFAWTLLQPRIYAASSSGLVIAGDSENIGNALAGDSLAKSKAVGYKSIATTRPVADRVINDMKLDETADSLLGRIEVTVPTGTAEIRITASSEGAEEARGLANAWVVALADQIKELESASVDGAERVSAVNLHPLGQAVLPSTPVSPNTKLALALGGLVGLAIGAAYAMIRNHLDRRIRSAEALELLGLSVVGTIPEDKRLMAQRAVVETGAIDHGDRAAHAFSEALRELRTNLNYIDVDNPPRIIVMTSSVPGEGKSSVTANLAVAIASTGRNVVLVDADLRRPVQTKLFDLIEGAGLTDVLSHSADIEDVLQPYGPVPNLQLLGSGRIPPNPSELLGSKAMKLLLKELARDAVVLVDAPPLLPVTDAAVLSTAADGILVAVRAGNTTSDEVNKALHNLRKVDANILGAILNQVPTKGVGAAQYGYYGKYYYSNTEEDSIKSGKPSSRLKKPTPPRASPYPNSEATPASAFPDTHIGGDPEFRRLRRNR